MSSVKKATITSVCIALCAILPLAFHALGLGGAFSPMHLPVFLCGLVCGWPYGLFCGIAGPVISSLATSMPATTQLIYFIPELAVYGLVSGLIFGKLRTGKLYLDLYLALLPAMLLGRIVGGAAQMLFYLATARGYSLALWAGGYLVGTLPGIGVQLVLLPLLYTVLEKSKLIPERYKKNIGGNHEQDPE